MEAQGSRAHLVHGAGAFLIEVGDRFRIGEALRELVLVQRPGVDVRVDAIGRRRAVQEGLALLPPLAGGEEGRADAVDVGLGVRVFLLQVGKLVVEGFRLVGQVVIDLVDDAGNIAFHGRLEGLLLRRQAGLRLRVLVAGEERRGRDGQDADQFECIHIAQCLRCYLLKKAM